MRKLMLALVASFALSACATTVELPELQTPAQKVFAAKGIFDAALVVANQYKALPMCPSSGFLCHEPSVVASIVTIAEAADDVLDAAEATVRNPIFAGSDTEAKVVISAQNAVAALTAITDRLRVQ
jgi:hypothetical protein